MHEKTNTVALSKCSRSPFDDEVATALQQACECDFDNEAMTLLKATRIIRRDMLDTKSKFNATFNKQLLDEVEHDIMDCQNRGLCYLPKAKAEAENTDTRF